MVDDSTRAVADAEASVIAEGHHLVTALVGKPSNGQLRTVESTGRSDDCTSASVQARDVLVAGREHHGVFALGAERRPIDSTMVSSAWS